MSLFVPTPLTSPVVNPSIGGDGIVLPWISISEYAAAPTAMPVNTLSAGGGPANKIALSQVIDRACSILNTHLFGGDVSPKGASLCVSSNTEMIPYKVFADGQIRLPCRYTPIITLTALMIGPTLDSMVSRQDLADLAIFTPTSIVIPGGYGGRWPLNPYGLNGRYVPNSQQVIWSYINGYPHLQLAANCAAGDTSIEVRPNSALSQLIGVQIGETLKINDLTDMVSPSVEDVVVESITLGGEYPVLNLTAPLQYGHVIPSNPDWISVSAFNGDLREAAILATTHLIKGRGDGSNTLDNATRAPKVNRPTRTSVPMTDLEKAFELLKRYKQPYIVKQ